MKVFGMLLTLAVMTSGSSWHEGQPSLTVESEEYTWDSRTSLSQTTHRRIVFDQDAMTSTSIIGDMKYESLFSRTSTTYRVFKGDELQDEQDLPTKAYDGFSFDDAKTFLTKSADLNAKTSGLIWAPWFKTKEDRHDYSLGGKTYQAVRVMPDHKQLMFILGPVEIKTYELDDKGNRVKQVALTVVTSMKITAED